jgi:hypothetical protein
VEGSYRRKIDMSTTEYKPKIVSFQKHQKLLAINWETLKRGFSITVEHGDAVIHTLPAPNARFGYAIGSGIEAEQIRRFFLRQDIETKLTEVVLEVTFEPNEKSLGLTDNVKEAEEWVREANMIIQNNLRKDI